MKYKTLKEKLKKDKVTFFVLTVEDLELILRSPNRNELSVITKMMANNEVKGAEYLFTQCSLGGDLKKILGDSDYFLGAMSKIESLFEIKKATIKAIDKKQFEITIEDKKCIIRKPNITDLGIIMSYAEKNPIKSNEVFLNKCWVSGDEIIKTDDDYFLSASSVLDKVINIKKSTIKKN